MAQWTMQLDGGGVLVANDKPSDPELKRVLKGLVEIGKDGLDNPPEDMVFD
ncbi:hypothetical protein [Actinoallomurus sp. NPDC052274]|uniref:hypothetical protein n=1 Tax=Actinoallomurus sp. NPDC052274 TaxID=3155420 RepID=UPI00342CC37B